MLAKPDQNGVTEREHLEQIERQIGRPPEGLEGPEFPSLLANVWSAFIRLSQARTQGMSGPNPITFEQIKAWKELTEYPLSPREVEVVKQLDSLWLKVANG